MGSVAQAVVEFDEAVQAPWRPPLGQGSGRRGQLRAVPGPVRHTPARQTPAPIVRRPLPVGPGPRRSASEWNPLRPVPPGLRLTRRARRLGLALGLAVGVVVGSWVGSMTSGDGDGGGLRLAGDSSVVVESGDTLWSIAASVAGSGDDVRAVVAQIRELNSLPDASLVPGQTLVLP